MRRRYMTKQPPRLWSDFPPGKKRLVLSSNSGDIQKLLCPVTGAAVCIGAARAVEKRKASAVHRLRLAKQLLRPAPEIPTIHSTVATLQLSPYNASLSMQNWTQGDTLLPTAAATYTTSDAITAKHPNEADIMELSNERDIEPIPLAAVNNFDDPEGEMFEDDQF